MNTKTQDLAQRAQRAPRHRKSISSLCGLGARFLLAVVFSAATHGADPATKPADLPEDLKRGLVLYLDFETKPVGDKITDLSGYKNDGKAVAVDRLADPQRGGVMKFGPKDSYITVRNNDSLNPPHLTLSVWIKRSSCDSYVKIISKRGEETGLYMSISGNSPEDTHQDSRQYQVNVASRHGGKKTIVSSGPDGNVLDGKWHHVVGTFGGAEARLYVDGRQPDGAQKPLVEELLPSTSDLTIGNNRSHPVPVANETLRSFNGLMDDVMMFNRALSADEVQALFELQGGKSASTPAARPQLSPSPAPGSGSPSTPADRIKQIKQLMERGEINQEEHDRRVKEVLDAI